MFEELKAGFANLVTHTPFVDENSPEQQALVAFNAANQDFHELCAGMRDKQYRDAGGLYFELNSEAYRFQNDPVSFLEYISSIKREEFLPDDEAIPEEVFPDFREAAQRLHECYTKLPAHLQTQAARTLPSPLAVLDAVENALANSEPDEQPSYLCYE